MCEFCALVWIEHFYALQGFMGVVIAGLFYGAILMAITSN